MCVSNMIIPVFLDYLMLLIAIIKKVMGVQYFNEINNAIAGYMDPWIFHVTVSGNNDT